ncbi:hypothetical protein HYC85_024606 [Camellia sinensis]|uniref:Uncharacterized protein n=1 Tax=Camellia sinensis TaxID=4442 RepID=A0A7J7G8L3_CAMSI|nr:hypothetical protein HYC85_024606 [Camellia sinensis]
MLRLAKRLLSKGLHVTPATTEIARHRMLTSSSATTTANSIDGISLIFLSDGLSVDHDCKTNLDHYMDSLGQADPANLSSIILHHHSHGGRKFSCIITNPFIPWASDVAVEHGIPCALLWLQPCSLYSIYYRFYNHLNQFPSSTNPNISVESQGLPLLNTEDLLSFVLPANPFGSFPNVFCGLFQNMKKMKWVLANSFHELKSQAIDSMFDIHLIRPIGREDQAVDTGVEMWKSEDNCIEWLINNNQIRNVISTANGEYRNRIEKL